MKIIIVGCGRNGSGLAEALSRQGHNVTVVDSNPAAFAALGSSFRGETVEGIGFDREVLLKAKIDRADALAAFTSSDESNAVIARMAKEIYRVPKVVARLYDREKAEIYRHMGIQTLSSTTWGIKRAVDLLTYSALDSRYSFGNGEVELVELALSPLLIGHQVSELAIPGEILVAAITRENKSFIPGLGTTLQKDDLLHIAVHVASADRLQRLFGLSEGKEI